MIKKILFYLLVFIIISNPVKAELQINFPENTILNPGQLKIIKVNITNSSDIKQTINPDLVLPKNWKLIIPLKSIIIGPNEKKNMNILLQPPKKIRSDIYPLNLSFGTHKKNYRIQIPVKIKEIYETEVKIVKSPRFIENKFEIKLKFINKGNISRQFKITNNNILDIDKSNIFLDSFESKMITFKCRIKEYEKEKVTLNIKVVDEQKNIISLFNETVIILDPNRKFKIYNSSFNYRVVKQRKEDEQYWKLKTLLNKNSFLEVGNNYFNYYQSNEQNRWQLGSEYFDRIKLKNSTPKNTNLKISYEFAQDNETKKIAFTNFVNEIGVGFLKYSNRNFYYLEIKKNKTGIIDYYLDTSIRYKNYHFNFERSKLNKNRQMNSFLRYEVNKCNNLKAGFSNLSLNENNNKKYVRYNHRGINNRITVDYSVMETRNQKSIRWGLSRKDFDLIGNYYLNSSVWFRKFEEKWNPEFKFILKNKKNKFLIKKDYKNRYGLEYQRKFKYKDGKLKLGINNYGSPKFNINVENEFNINHKEFYINGNFSYDSSKSFELKKIEMGINISFAVKTEKKPRNKVVGKISAKQKKLGGLILDINGQKVKTNTDGSFTAYISPAKKVLIKAVDLGMYTGKYIFSPVLPYLIEDYSQETIFIDLIEVGNLKLKFKKNDYKRHNYLEAITDNEKQEIGSIILYNDQHTFLKKLKGEKELSFKNIPPGQYRLKTDNKRISYNYEFKNMNIKIKPGNNQITISKSSIKNKKLKLEKEAGKIKIDN